MTSSFSPIVVLLRSSSEETRSRQMAEKKENIKKTVDKLKEELLHYRPNHAKLPEVKVTALSPEQHSDSAPILYTSNHVC